MDTEQLTLDEVKAKIASLQELLIAKMKEMLKSIGDQIEECAANRGVDVEQVLRDIAKHYGYEITKVVAVVPKKAVRKGKPSVKQPLKDKLDAAGVKCSSQLNIAQLEELVAKHNL